MSICLLSGLLDFKNFLKQYPKSSSLSMYPTGAANNFTCISNEHLLWSVWKLIDLPKNSVLYEYFVLFRETNYEMDIISGQI